MDHDLTCAVTDPGIKAAIASAVSRVPRNIPGVHFLPWVGGLYTNDGFFGPRRIFILGESHYEWCEACWKLGIVRGGDHTCRCVADAALLREDKRIQHWRNIEYALTGQHLEDDARERFWNSVVYYNYVQEVVGYVPEGGERLRPTNAMWEQARDPFLKVLALTSPDAVLVLGRDLWSKLPDEDEGSLKKNAVSGRTLEWCTYTLPSGKVVHAYGVPHPAAGLGAPWHEMLAQALGIR